MKQLSVKKNFILSTFYQILTLIIPFITAPYISRVLGADGVGLYSYTYSIEMYFSMFAALGTVSYGTREIARNRNDRYKRSKLFWEIELLTVFTTTICLAFWAVWIIFNTRYKIYYLILTFYLLATMFDISWFFTGLEQFKYIVIQNSIFKLAGIIVLFIFVRTSSDVGIYIMIMSLTVLLSNMGMWIYLPKFISRVSMNELHVFVHFRETLIYFVPTIATSIYTVLDKTLIGVITKSVSENGYYEQATKIINMAKTITFTALNSVLGARISYLFAAEKYNEIHRRIELSVDYILFMGIGICFGLIGISERFVPLFFGHGYEKVVILLKLLSPIVVIIGVSNCLGSQYYTPAGLRGLSAKFLIVGSLINLVLNLILIPKLWSYGAVIASVLAELSIAVLYLKFCNGFITFKYLIKSSYKKIFSGVIMLLVISYIDGKLFPSIFSVSIEVIVGGLVYILLLLILKDSFFMRQFGQKLCIILRKIKGN